MLVLLTDGRHNPSNPDAAPSFRELTELYPNFVPGEDWFLHYIVLKPDVADPEALEFVRWAGGAFTPLSRIAELTAALQTLRTPISGTVTDIVGRCSVRPADIPGWKPAAMNAAVQAGMMVETGPDARAVVRVRNTVHIGLDPATSVVINEATWDPLHESGRLLLTVHAGAIEVLTDDPRKSWDVELRTGAAQLHLTGTRVRLSADPGEAGAHLQVRNGGVVVVDSSGEHPVTRNTQVRITARGTIGDIVALPPEDRGMSAAWDAPLEGGSLLESGPRFVRVAWEALQWDVGPLTAGQTWTRTAEVSLAGLTPEALASATAHIQATVPVDLALTVQLERPGPVGSHRVQLTATTSDTFVPVSETVYPSRVVLSTSSDESLGAFPLRLWTKVVVAAPAATVLPPPKRTGWGIMIGFGVCGLLVMILIVGVRGRTGGRVPIEGVGRLLVLENPVPKTWDKDFINLDEHTRKGAGKVSIGSSRYCNIVLPHDSVEEHHCSLVITQTRVGTAMRIETMGDSVIRLNDKPCTGLEGVVDRTEIGIGWFTLQYEDSGAKPQVLVHLKDGKAVRGALHAWDLSSPTFRIAPDDAHVTVLGGPIRDIKFSEVQDIAMLRLGPSAKRSASPPSGQEVTVRYPGGRTLQGVLWANYNATAAKFTLVPNDSPDIDYIVVVRANTDAVDAGDDPDDFIP